MQTAHHRALMVPHHDRISNLMGLVQPEGRTQNANVRQFYVRTEVTSAVDMLQPRGHSSQQTISIYISPWSLVASAATFGDGTRRLFCIRIALCRDGEEETARSGDCRRSGHNVGCRARRNRAGGYRGRNHRTGCTEHSLPACISLLPRTGLKPIRGRGSATRRLSLPIAARRMCTHATDANARTNGAGTRSHVLACNSRRAPGSQGCKSSNLGPMRRMLPLEAERKREALQGR